MRAGGGSGEAAGWDRIDGAGAADLIADGHGELIPTDAAFVAIVIDSGDEAGAVDDVKDGGGEVGGIGR